MSSVYEFHKKSVFSKIPNPALARLIQLPLILVTVNGKVSTSDNRPGIARTNAFRRDHLPGSFNHKQTVSVLYQFKVKHLGSTTYTLLAESAHDRDTWCHHLREPQTSFAHSLHEQNAEPFRLGVLSDTALQYEVLPHEALRTPLRVSDTPLNIAITQAESSPGPVQGRRSISSARVYCASSFTALGEPIVAIGTADDIFIWNDMDLHRMNHSRWTKTVTIPGVTQMSLALEDFGLFLIISGGDLFANPLELITPKDSIPPRTPRKVAKSVSFFSVAKIKDRTSVFYEVQDGPFRTLLKVLEPLPPPETAPKTGRLSRSRSPPETIFFREYDEFFLSTECSSLSIFQTYIAVAATNGFEMLTLHKKQPMTIPDLKEPSIAAIASLIKDQKPLKMFRLNNDEFLLAYERCAVYVDKHGDVSRTVVMEYISKARGVTSATMHGAYLILFTDEYVEVRNAENGRLRQIIAGKDIRILDYGSRLPGGDLVSSSQTQAEDDIKQDPSGTSDSKGTIKFAMGHPRSPSRQLVLEMCLKEGH